MKKIDLLRDLQDLDTQLDAARRELEECRSRLGDDSELVPLRAEADSARQEVRSLQSKGRDLDDDLETRSSKLKANERKLYSGTVKNPKDLSSLAHEVELEKAQVRKIEDEVLVNMEALEAATAREAEAKRRLSEAESAWRAVQADLQSRCRVLSEQVERLSLERGQIASGVDAPTLRTYESIRRTRGGLAVAAIERGACHGCRVGLSSSVTQRARAGAELVTCQSCGRLLYVP